MIALQKATLNKIQAAAGEIAAALYADPDCPPQVMQVQLSLGNASMTLSILGEPANPMTVAPRLEVADGFNLRREANTGAQG